MEDRVSLLGVGLMTDALYERTVRARVFLLEGIAFVFFFLLVDCFP